VRVENAKQDIALAGIWLSQRDHFDPEGIPDLEPLKV
jgi:hypothetical protein